VPRGRTRAPPPSSHDEAMDYPLTLSFRILAIAPQFSVVDAKDQSVFYVRQKAFKLKEHVNVFADQQQSRQVATIAADRIIDFNATYRFTDPSGMEFGAVQRSGMRSIWRAHYQVLRGGVPIFQVNEENPWAKVGDGFLMEIPVLNLLSGYVFHPSYRVTKPDGRPVLRMKKQPAFLESRFQIQRLGPIETEEEALAILSLLMVVLLERRRG
jgi:hypothetical protein